MKKLMAILVFAGVLSVPSAVFADASWYGSLRAGLKSSDSKISVVDGGSRWGIKGSNEAGEGLSAVYRFEHKISTEDAGQPAGRLAYVGLSGGFGTVTAGQIWSASFNSFGAVTDNSAVHGNAQVTYRHGNVISYAFSNDLMSMQLDGAYGGPEGNDTDPDTGLQKVEFGLSVNIGDIGKVALSHQNDKYTMTPAGLSADNDNDANERTLTGASTWETKTNSIAAEISVSDLTVYVGTQTNKGTNTTADGTLPTVDQDYIEGLGLEHEDDATYVGPHVHGSDVPNTEQKTTFFGFRGGLGDTGLNYLFQWRDVKDSHKPWMLGLYKSLGGGADIIFEHVNNDDNAENLTAAYLRVNF